MPNGFMMTQFFQVLKPKDIKSALSICFMMTQFFQVLKQWLDTLSVDNCFMMTQFFQVLKQMYKLFTNVFVL